MKTIFALAAVAVAASLIGAIPVLHSSFAAPSANDNQPAANPNSTQAQDVQDNNSGGNNDKETNDATDQERNDGNGSGNVDSINPQLASQAKITADQAKSTAMTNVSAQPSDVKSVSLDDENGHLVYSIEITKAGQSFDVKVDAISGQVANVDQGMDGESADDGNSGSDDAETNDDGNSAVDNHSDGEQADDAAKP